MSDIQRYTLSGVMTPVKPDAVTTTKWIQEPAHLKAIEAKDQYISHHNIVLDGQSEMIAKRDKTIKAKDKKIADKNRKISLIEEKIRFSDQLILQQSKEIEAQAKEIAELENEVERLKGFKPECNERGSWVELTK